MKYLLRVDFEDGNVIEFGGTDLDNTIQRYQQLMGKLQLSTIASEIPDPPQQQYPVPLPPEPQQADPWAPQPSAGPSAPVAMPPQAVPAASFVPPASTQLPPAQYPQYPPQQPAPAAAAQAVPGVPMCNHGPRKFVPAGISKRTNQPYPAFWACPANRNDPSNCGSLPA